MCGADRNGISLSYTRVFIRRLGWRHELLQAMSVWVQKVTVLPLYQTPSARLSCLLFDGKFSRLVQGANQEV